MKSKIVIIDYDTGNVKSLSNALNLFTKNIKISRDIKEINDAAGLILPGVGAFWKAMDNLTKFKLVDAIYKHTEQNKPFLGICVGMQVLLDSSEEFTKTKGLGLISGNVIRFKSKNLGSKKTKIPLVSWKKLYNNNYNINWSKTILDGLKDSDLLYFIHSYYADIKNLNNILSYSKFENFYFPSVIQYKNIIGCQFHPEKSSYSGLKVINNFVKLCFK